MSNALAALRLSIRAHSEPLARALTLTKLPAHADTVVLSFLCFTAVQHVLAPPLLRLLVGDAYTKAGRRTRAGWTCRVSSMVHALTVVVLGFRAFDSPALEKDRAFGWDEKAGTVSAIAIGYFLWDLMDTLMHLSDVGFLVHAVACLGVYASAMKPFAAYYSPRFIVWELSTIFLNFHWFFDKAGKTGSALQYWNGVALLATFAGTRLIYGGIASYDFLKTLLSVRDELPTPFFLIYVAGNITLNGLNWYWFRKMILALQKRFTPADTNGHLGSGKALASGKARLTKER